MSLLQTKAIGTPPSSSLKLNMYMIEHVVVDSSPPDAELVNVICELIMVGGPYLLSSTIN